VTLWVSMPTFKTPRNLLGRAARSVLASEGVDVRLIVVNDGGPEEYLRELPRDPRMTKFSLRENRGRYFSDAVVTQALSDRPGDVWTVLDSDDYVEPKHYATLLRELKNGAALSVYHRHYPTKKSLQQPSRARLAKPDENFVHLGHWCSGAYQLERVARAGGIHPGFRVGFDTLFVLMLSLTGPVDVCDTPGYHWQRRRTDSLTTARETRFGSPHRQEAKKRLVELYRRAWELRDDDPGRAIREDVDAKLAEEVTQYAERLRRILNG